MVKLQEDNRLHQDRKKSLISRHSRQQARFHLRNDLMKAPEMKGPEGKALDFNVV
jgi:hypothetical protein